MWMPMRDRWGIDEASAAIRADKKPDCGRSPKVIHFIHRAIQPFKSAVASFRSIDWA